MRMKATLKNYGQSPRKVRLVADMVRGKKVPHALVLLRLSGKRAGVPVGKLLRSAVSNAAREGKDANSLVVGRVFVNEGATLKRYRPRAFGRATPLRRKMSTVHITLQESV